MLASMTFFPLCIKTIIDSLITIALSTNNPKEIIRAAKETWSSQISNIDITMNEVKIDIGIKTATIRPVRNPKEKALQSQPKP